MFFIYYNLHKHLFSMKHIKMNRVVDHAETVVLANCEFKVSEAGRKRVLKEKRKNVHAGVKGYLCRNDLCGFNLDDFTEITYNPYKYSSFVVKKTQQPIGKAKLVILHKRKVYALGIERRHHDRSRS